MSTTTSEKLDALLERLSEVRKAEMEFKARAGQFDQDFQTFLRENNVPEQFHLVELIQKFSSQSKILTLS